MRLLTPLLVAPALLLAACNSEQTQANSENRRTGQQVPTTPNPPASTPETTASINNGAPAATTGRLPVSAPGAGAAVLAGRTFAAQSGTLTFGPGNEFNWRDQAGKTLSGRFVQEAERISFNEVKSPEAGASIPMTCRFRMDGPNRFIVEDSGTTCPVFRGLTFQAQG